MQQENWEKVKEIIQEVVKLKPSERTAFLDQADLKDEVRTEVDSLLAFEKGAENLMDLSAVEFSQQFFEEDDGEIQNALVGQQIGIYRIIKELGFGGMGAVYLADRTDGKFDQKVALKLLKREMNTGEIRRRFQQERKILASLEHPNIARLLDAGTTDDQIPFLIMEYVEGLPIDDYCEKHNLDLQARLDLFRSVCRAVNFAHRNLIVHRDLKPSNILVTKDGIPKLLDFGISKILSADFENLNQATVTKLGAMTPAYASPEQLQSKSVTTATDIYSLGVILYELLSGHRPFKEKEKDLKEIFRAVIETEPPPPSAMIETISRLLKEKTSAKTELKEVNLYDSEETLDKSKHKTESNKVLQTAPKTLLINAQTLRGDLDNMVLKALRKEPERRYLSAEDLAEDIKRYLRSLPVTARPNTFSYRAEKFIKRNKATMITAAMILLAVIAGITATLWQAHAAQIERIKAEKRFSDVRQLANSYIFDVYPEIENLEGSLKAREKIVTNALKYLDSLSGEAGGDLELQSELATAYEKIGDVQGALNNSSLGKVQAGLESYAKAQKLREAIYQADPAKPESKEKLANNYYVAARTLWNNSQTKEAEEAFKAGLKLRRELVANNPDSIEMKNRLATLLIDYGAIPVFNAQTEKALVLFNEAQNIIENLQQKDPRNPVFKKTLARLLRIQSKAKASLGDYEGGIRGLTTAAEISRELAGQFPDDFRIQRSVWLTNSITCELYINKQDGLKAIETCVPAIDFPKTALLKEPENGVVAFDLAISHFHAARAFRLSKNFQQTIVQSEKAIEVMSNLIKKSSANLEYKRNVAVYQTEMARAQISLKKYDEAIAGLQKTVQAMIPIAEVDKETTEYRNNLSLAYRLLAQSYAEKGDRLQAVEFIDKSITIVQQLKNADSLRDSDKNLLAELELEKADYSK